jgi:hypothetical protein
MSTKREGPLPAISDAALGGPREVTHRGVLRVAEVYQAWREAETQCGEALRTWWEAGPDDGRLRYAAYRAVLDREESAARHLRHVWEQAQGS